MANALMIVVQDTLRMELIAIFVYLTAKIARMELPANNAAMASSCRAAAVLFAETTAKSVLIPLNANYVSKA
jgi:hypothetical protein